MLATFTVTTTADGDAGSLRRAIVEANATPGADVIRFDIPAAPGSVSTITPASALPQVRSPLAIDGTTQPGYAGTPLIELSGAAVASLSSAIVLAAGADGSVVRGLVVNRWRGAAAISVSAGGCVVERNYIGTDPTGSVDRGNGGGVYLSGAFAAARDCVVADNLISGNGAGITSHGPNARNNVIVGNRIGTNAAVTGAIPNDTWGVHFVEFPSGNRVGGTSPREGNVIAGNGSALNGGGGVGISGDGNVVSGNWIGVLPGAFGPQAPPAPLGNGGSGVSVTAAPGGVTITGNTIAHNAGFGVIASAESRVAVTGNRIYNNQSLGIDLAPLGMPTPNDAGDADAVQNDPVIASAVASVAGDAVVSGSLDSLPSARFRLDFYVGANVGGDKDPSGFGEGARPVGTAEVTTDAAGHAQFGVTLPGVPAGDVVTATASRFVGERLQTSEFSRYVTVSSTSGPLVRQVFVRSSAWAAAFVDHLAAAGMGAPVYGFAVPGGAAQTAVLPWVGIDRVGVQFSEAVTVRPEHLSVSGVRVAEYPVAGMTYNANTRTAYWSLTTPIVNDKVRIRLGGGVATGVAGAGGTPLDGEWANGADAYPSGDGVPGGDFDFRLNVVAGDVNRNGVVLADDFSEVRRKFFSTAANPGAGPAAYSIFHDVNGSASILADDFSDVKRRFFNTLPGGEPAASSVPALRRLDVAAVGRALPAKPSAESLRSAGA